MPNFIPVITFPYPMMTSSMETFSALLAICAGNSPVTGEFPTQRPVTRSFDVLFHLRLNKQLSKQSWGWWFETLSRSLWRHCNANHIASVANFRESKRPLTVESPWKPIETAPHVTTGLTLISACISNYIHYDMWNDMYFPFPTVQSLKFGNG